MVNEKDKIIPPLSRDEFSRRVESLFNAFYLMMVSIIQGVALSLLISTYIDVRECATNQDHLGYAVVTFFILAVVVYEYTTVAGVFRWIPGFCDVLIPFSVGAAELLMIVSIGNPIHWWGYGVLFFAFGIAAYFNTLANISIDKFEQSELGQQLYNHARKAATTGIFVLATAFLYFLITYLLMRFDKSPFDHIIFLAIFSVLIAAFLIRQQNWLIKVGQELEERS